MHTLTMRLKGKSDQTVGQVKKAAEKMVDKALDIAQSSKPYGGSDRSPGWGRPRTL